MLLVAEKHTSLILKIKIQVVAKPEKFTCIEGMVWTMGIKYHLSQLPFQGCCVRRTTSTMADKIKMEENPQLLQESVPCASMEMLVFWNACCLVQPEFLWNPPCDSPEQSELRYGVDGNMLQLQSCYLGDCPSSWEILFYKRNNIS